MKVLIAALGEQHDIKEAFAKVADIIYWDWTKQHNWQFNQSLKALVENHNPDLVFMQVQADGIVSPTVMRELSEKTKIINWTGDMRIPTPQWFIDVGANIHMTCFTNMLDVYKLRNLGMRAEYLQIGFPDKIFCKQTKPKHEADIVFMGNNYGHFPLSKLRFDMVSRLSKRYGDMFKCFGGNFHNGVYSVTNQHEEAAIYRGAKIGINLSHYEAKRYTSDRMFRIIGAGCMCLSHNYEEIETEFTPGIHLDVWSDLSSLFSKIDYYLEHEDERAQMAENGYKHAHNNHTWTNRVNELIKMV